MDILEGVRSGHYYKRQITVRLEQGEDLTATAYFYPANEQLLGLPQIPAYTKAA